VWEAREAAEESWEYAALRGVLQENVAGDSE